MPITTAKTTYVEMRSPPNLRVEPPFDGVEIVTVNAPSSDDYLTWYKAVGEAWLWADRLQMPPDKLRQWLDDPRVEVLLLRVHQQPAGFVEIDLRNSDEVEIVYFGLFPQFIGQGLGKYFLNAITHYVWQHAPHRLWLHTCEFDSEAALPNYLQAGFEVYDEKLVDKVIP